MLFFNLIFFQYKNRLPWAQRLRFLLDALYGLRAVHNGVYIVKVHSMYALCCERTRVTDF